jgi:lysophospholipase L1-like esterase
MPSTFRVFLFSVAGLAMMGCAGAASPAHQGTGGAGASTPGGATGGSSSAEGTGGAEATGGSSGAKGTGGAPTGTGGGSGGRDMGGIPGTGGIVGTDGTGGREPGTGGEGARGGNAPATGGTAGGHDGTATGGGHGGNVGGGGSSPMGSGGSGGKPDQGSLPAITIHMAGDSTMANYASSTTQEGWGQEFGQFFITKVTIDNQAQGGANIQSFYGSRWKTLMSAVKAGDYVMAAFGINDSGTTHGPVTPQDFQAQMETMAAEVAAKKATFIPTTSSPLQAWANGKETNTRLQPYCDATKAVGTGKDLLVDDLNARGIEYYDTIGEAAAQALTFNGDKAHFNKQGATEMARLASQDLRRINSPLAAYLK